MTDQLTDYLVPLVLAASTRHVKTFGTLKCHKDKKINSQEFGLLSLFARDNCLILHTLFIVKKHKHRLYYAIIIFHCCKV